MNIRCYNYKKSTYTYTCSVIKCSLGFIQMISNKATYANVRVSHSFSRVHWLAWEDPGKLVELSIDTIFIAFKKRNARLFFLLTPIREDNAHEIRMLFSSKSIEH